MKTILKENSQRQGRCKRFFTSVPFTPVLKIEGRYLLSCDTSISLWTFKDRNETISPKKNLICLHVHDTLLCYGSVTYVTPTSGISGQTHYRMINLRWK